MIRLSRSGLQQSVLSHQGEGAVFDRNSRWAYIDNIEEAQQNKPDLPEIFRYDLLSHELLYSKGKLH